MDDIENAAPRTDAAWVTALHIRAEAGRKTTVDGFTIDPETGEVLLTPLWVLRTFAKRQKVRDWTGRIYAAEDLIRMRIADAARETTRSRSRGI